MKKKLSILFICGCLTGCKTFTFISEQNISRQSGTTPFEIVQNQMIVKPIVNGKECAFVFDTGLGGFIVTNVDLYKNIPSDKITTLGYVRMPDNSLAKKKNIVMPFSLGFAQSKNVVFQGLDKFETACKNSYQNTSGIFGLGYINSIDRNDTFIGLNFSENNIENFAEIDFKIKLKDYIEIKSQFVRNSIYLFMNIAGEENKLLFDTGNAGSIILTKEPKKIISREVFQTEGANFSSIKSKIAGQNKLVANEPILFGNDSFLSNINVTTGISKNNAGIKFIKAFDWLIDFKKQKIYVKKNYIPIDNSFDRYFYKSFVVNNKLTIYLKEISQTKYNVGDQIISINGQKVNAENNCEMQDLLNKDEDWSTLQLQVVPVKK